MLISLKLTQPIPIKMEPDDESGTTTQEDTKVPELTEDDFDFCAGCKKSFKPKIYINGPIEGSSTTTAAEGDGTTGEPSQVDGTSPRRGQQNVVESNGEERKVKEFYR